jgi:hypothetical protein
MLLMVDDGGPGPGPAEIGAMPDFLAWQREMGDRGVLRGGARLRPAGDARTVRVREGRMLVADGPFAETGEMIGGYEVIECADLDEAIDIAAKHPSASRFTIEIRPFWRGES